MNITDVFAGVDFLAVSIQDGERAVAGVEYDSRRVVPGSVFVAMRGGSSDGNHYVKTALAAGAAAVVTDSEETFAELKTEHTVGLVSHGRTVLAALAANYFAHPEEKLKLIGVTGTNGKTTTAFIAEAMLNAAGRKCVLVGTIEVHIAGEVQSTPHTTPESRDLFELMSEGVRRGATEMVMEVSSHALDQGRVASLPFDVAVFTNLTRDHLDYHGTMEEYFAVKKRLFDGKRYAAPRVAVVNAEDEYGVKCGEASRAAGAIVWTYGTGGDLRAEEIRMRAGGMEFVLVAPQGRVKIATRLTGRVNVANLLAASGAVLARGLSLKEVAVGAAALACVPGRFQTVDCGQSFAVVVDYAHTDDALRNLTALAREFVKPHGGRVITLFGCGGDRDRLKRPMMGKAAGEGSDFVVLTSDNPRSEDPASILAEVQPGLDATGVRYSAVVDRHSAIELAIRSAKAGDIVLLAGKGHEKVQIVAGREIPFDDAEVAREILKGSQ